MCLIDHLPFLFLLFQHFLYLDSTQLKQANPWSGLPRGCNHCHTGTLALLVRKRHTYVNIHLNFNKIFTSLLLFFFSTEISQIPFLLLLPCCYISTSDPGGKKKHKLTGIQVVPFCSFVFHLYLNKKYPVHL